IIFKGMDKPAKLKSINNVSIIWIEECSEVKYAGFKELLGRLRHPTLELHMILSTNPVSKNNWCYKHFFMDTKKKIFILDDKELYKNRIIIKNNTYYHHSLADDNLFLPKTYIEQLDELKTYDIDLYRIARRGRFGVNGRKVLPQFEKKPHYEVLQAIQNIKNSIYRVGMDFGFETSYNAIVRLAIDDENKILYIYWQYYKNQMTDDKTAIEIAEFKKTQELIRSDSAEPKTIKYYKQEGFNMRGAKKFQGSRLQNTKKVKRFKRIIC
ncbi:PBSX family phage terminase large subunit, partial [Clostridium botulinum]|uniref:PBSX family phage terminase large subunit n=1 Tax=Clostridium botulinum TaxID=1491 RepID=UPI000A7BD9E2